MKKIRLFLYFASTGTLLFLSSCTKKIDEAYINPNANVVQPIELLLPNIIQNLVVSNTAAGTLYGTQNDGQYVGRYVQFWATNTSNNQYDQMGGATGGSDILGSIWAMHYYGMGQNLNRVIEWGTEQKKWDYVGVAYAIRAWSWLMLTDMYGEAILKDAFNTSLLVFHYDSQQDIYQEVKKDVNLAIENLSKTGDGVSPTNLAAGAQYTSMKGDVEKWKKFAYAVMARVYNRTTNKSSYNADSVIHYANLAINSNADNAYVLFEGTSTIKMSYYGPSRGNIGTFRQTKFAADLFSGVNPSFAGAADPRAWYKLRENANGTFKGIRPTKGFTELTVAADQPPNFWGGTGTTGSNANTRYIWRDAMPWPVITASEMQFLKAEAYYRKNMKSQALSAYTDGIRLDFDMLTTVPDYGNAVPPAHVITAGIRDTYLADPAVVPSLANFNLSHIMLQKFIALYGYGFVETWVDLRRFHYTDFETGTTRQVYTDFAPPAPNELFADNHQKVVYRARPRYNSEYLYNVDALNQIGAMVGNAIVLDYNTKEMWFSMY
jgi:hypothetical protein